MATIPASARSAKAESLLNPGWYPMMVTDTQVKQTKAQDGEYLLLQQVIADGEHRGTTIWNMINWVNKNPKAEEIAHKQWANLCQALGIDTDDVSDTEEIHGQIIDGYVVVQKSKNPAYDDKNVVRKWRKAETVPENIDEF